MLRTNQINILSYFLGFVVLYFGVNEITSPEKWVAFVPKFFDLGISLISLASLVFVHGLVLTLSGLFLIFNFHRRKVAIVLVFLLAQIVITLFSVSGLDEIVVRDFGLLGIALALSVKS